jgi:hypothetical protein
VRDLVQHSQLRVPTGELMETVRRLTGVDG